MPSCSVITCKNKSDKVNFTKDGISFHMFPKDPKVKEKWIEATGHPASWFPFTNSRICSVHFKEEMFQPLNKSRRLFEWAVPKLKVCHVFSESDKVTQPEASCSQDLNKPLKCELTTNYHECFDGSTCEECTENTVETQHIEYIDAKPTREELCVAMSEYSSNQNSPLSEETPRKRKLQNTDILVFEENTIKKEKSEASLNQQNNLESDEQANAVYVVTLTPRNEQICNAKLVCDTAASRERKMRIQILKRDYMIKKQRLRIRSLQKMTSRYCKNTTCSENILEDLYEKKLLNADQIAHLENIGANDLINQFKVDLSSNKNVEVNHSPDLRGFACTLYFYSPRAYEYVKKFNDFLPHVHTIKKWYESVDGEPGFTREALKALKHKALSTNCPLICNLAIIEMQIRRHVEWDGKKLHGYVDICNTGKSGDYLAEAKDALVFLVTAINGAFKIPVGYFLVAGVTGEQRSELVKQCLELLEETDIQINSLTFDGCPANISMVKTLGCSFDADIQKTSFEHPVTGNPIYIFPDPSHMMKLIRNAFEANGEFVDYYNRYVKWCLLKNVNAKQERNLMNNSRRGHVLYKSQRMNFCVSSQLFGSSVAERSMDDLQDINGTAYFFKIVNDLFDIMTSRHIAQVGYKKPLFHGNKVLTFEFLDKAEMYIKSLKLSDGTKVIVSNRKTGFIGLLTCIRSLKNIYIHYIEHEALLHYVPAYKITQDHLEFMFVHLRDHGRFSELTSRQFQAIYKKLLALAEPRDSSESGHGITLEKISLLSCSTAEQNINLTIEPRILNDNREYETESLYEQAVYDDPSTARMLFEHNMSEFSSQGIVYIAACVVQALFKTLKCETCIRAMITDNIYDFQIQTTNKGRILCPSNDVINICKRLELVVKAVNLSKKSNTELGIKNLKEKLISQALRYFVGMDLFGDVTFHQYEQSPINNHVTLLIKAVMEKFINIRLYNYNAKSTISKPVLLSKYLNLTGK